MIESKQKQRAIVYIDGYNLYHGMRADFGKRYNWLDLQALSESLLHPETALVAVKYFTAITKSTSGSKHRQDVYLKALQAHCAKLEIFYGRFLLKSRRFQGCQAEHKFFEEKKTDVNIACEIINDAYLDRYDLCYLVSGDSDLVPPLRVIKQPQLNKRSIVAHPPRRKSSELCSIANGCFAIGRAKFAQNQLPETIYRGQKRELTKPAEWS